MDDVIMIEIPVTPEAAEALSDHARRQRIGKLVSSLLRPEYQEWEFIYDLKNDKSAAGLQQQQQQLQQQQQQQLNQQRQGQPIPTPRRPRN